MIETIRNIFYGVVIPFMLLWLAVDLSSTRLMLEKLQTQTIENGYALYCPTNGEFAWVGECQDKENE